VILPWFAANIIARNIIEREPRVIHDVIYDTPDPAVAFQASRSICHMQYAVLSECYYKMTLLLLIDSCAAAALNEELETEKYVDMDPTALQYCPAYETGSCIKGP
jgi:hypothetical protein